ncbi:MAG TPA: terpene synthase family protein [Chloroflexota bacterium]
MPCTPARDSGPGSVGQPTPVMPADAWGGLRSRFVASLDAEQQRRIFELSTLTSRPLRRWALRFPPMRDVRVLPVSLSVAASTPFASARALQSMARLSLWVFTLDDLFDEGAAPLIELMRRADRYRALAHGAWACPRDDGLGIALAELRNDLASYPLFAPLAMDWADALCATIDGMLREYEWRLAFREAAVLPDYDEYVTTGRQSIGAAPYILATLITSEDPSTPRHLAHLRTMEQVAATCLRLANDLRSYAKEVAEGKINALVILSRELRSQGAAGDEADRQARARLRAGVAGGLGRLGALRDSAVTQTGQPEAAIDNIARFVCDFYTRHDYHTFKPRAA